MDDSCKMQQQIVACIFDVSALCAGINSFAILHFVSMHNCVFQVQRSARWLHAHTLHMPKKSTDCMLEIGGGGHSKCLIHLKTLCCKLWGGELGCRCAETLTVHLHMWMLTLLLRFHFCVHGLEATQLTCFHPHEFHLLILDEASQVFNSVPVFVCSRQEQVETSTHLILGFEK